MKKILLVIIILFSFITNGRGEIKFERYTTDDGLPATYVLDIKQDHFGFMWFAMRGSCCRFDGFNFKTFPVKTNNGYQKMQTWVSGIVLDKENRLWIGDGEYGLLLFDNNKEVFINYYDTLKLPEQFDKINTTFLFCDSKGILWIGAGDYGIIKFNPYTKTSKHYRHNPDDPNSIPEGIVTYITEADDNSIWIGTSTQLSKFDRVSQKFILFNNIPRGKISCILKDSENIIWIGGEHGLYMYNNQTLNIEHVKISNNKSINVLKKFILSMYEDKKKRLWIGTTHGLYVMDRSTKLDQWYYYNDTDQETINSNYITKIIEDRTENLWIGTSQGIAKIKNQKFKTFRYSANKNSISQNKIQYIYENKDKSIWISTPKGIDVFKRENDTFQFKAGISKDGKGLYRTPIVFCEDPDKGIWIGTYLGGLNFYDYKTNRFSYFLADPQNPHSLSHNSVSSILIDKEKNMWIGTLGGGLDFFDRKKNEFEHFIHDGNNSNSVPSNFIRCLLKDSGKNIWIGASGGIAVLQDINTGKFKRIITNENLQTDKALYVFQLLEAINKKYIWAATNLGLLKINISSKQLKIYTEENGLPTANIAGILEDENENLWVSTSNGLVKIKPQYKNAVKKLNCKIFNKSDGLQGNEFLPASCCKLHDGTMLFGGTNGFSMFNPDSISDNPYPPQLAFTKLEVSNSIVQIDHELNGQVILEKAITCNPGLILNHKNNNFNIEFIALHFNRPQNNSYSYKLEGFDNDWQITNAHNRKVHYMNLEEGKYTLYVKASNSDGLWSDVPASLNIKILPPWWRTIWFRLISFILISGLIITAVKLRTYNLQKQKYKLEKTIAQRTLELKEANTTLSERKEELENQMEQMAEMNEELKIKSAQVKTMAEQLHEKDQSKLKFFANISHEFRTPLTLIISPLEKYAKYKKLNNINEWMNINNQLKLALRNANRLLRLVNQLIDFRKLDSNIKQIQITNNNIREFVSEIVKAFSALAESKGIQLLVKSEELRVKNEELREKSEELGVKNEEQNSSLVTHHSSLISYFWYDPDVMEKILYNLISNAIKYTPEGGEINIQLRVKSEELTVKDDNTSYSKSTNQHNNQSEYQNLSLITHHSSLIIKITDTGIGIKPESLNKIFDRFYRVEMHGRSSLPENHYEGTGIGLAYTKELVEFHKGSISVESETGKGATFILKFPFGLESGQTKNGVNAKQVVSEQQKSIQLNYIKSMIEIPDPKTENQQIETEEQAVNNNEKPSILVVEDNIDLRIFLKGELTEYYNVYEAENGKTGIEKAVSFLPDLIISDVMMPVADGLKLCENLKTDEKTSHIPIILLTAKTGEEATIKGLNTGADDYLTKPVRIPVLLARINNILNIRKNLRQKFSSLPLEYGYKISTTNSTDENFLKKATIIVEENIANDGFNNENFIQLMGMSRSLVYKKLKNLTDQSVSDFIRTIRLKRAARYLLEESNTISEVAYLVGFKHAENFTRYFTAFYKLSPSKYIQKYKAE